MSGPQRMPLGGSEIDRTIPLGFSFDGESYSGVAGDTLASALLANGVRIVGRSFKYHRPRGIFSVGGEEPNAILDLRHGARHDPNARATIEPLAEAMVLRSIHAHGTARHDRLRFLDRFARFIPAAFYYKTFMWPNWGVYENTIRRMAGLGRVDHVARAGAAAHRHLNVEVCVIGAGPAGLAAAVAAVREGKQVLLVDDQPRLGGSLLWREARIDGLSGLDWVDRCQVELHAAGAQMLSRTTAVGLYDHNAIVLVQKGLDAKHGGNGECLWQVRAREFVLASGAIERPLLFANNDRPGVMLAGAALAYLRRYAVRAGERVVVATGNDSAYEVAHALRDAGAHCQVVDSRPTNAFADAARAAGIAVHSATSVDAAIGKLHVEGVRLASGITLSADLLAVSGGWTPLINLYCHARGKPRWDAGIAAFVPDAMMQDLRVAGAANGARDLTLVLEQGTRAGGGAAQVAAQADVAGDNWGSAPDLTQASGARRVWVDLQHDVTTKDIELAVRENFTSVEHLKRYTTLGMATDQGKTSSVNGLAILASLSGRDIGAVGVTTFRPPFVPVSMATIAGKRLGELQAPLRRLAAENTHRAEGAYLREYGDILRPAWYGPDQGAVARECHAARNSVVAFDASSLGKIEVIGPDAGQLLDFIYYTRMSTLRPGRLRYAIALSESGAIFDDGVVLCLTPQHFVVSCSSSHVAAMLTHLEQWREDRFDLRRVFVHDASAHYATIAISGPQSKRVLKALDLGVALDDDQFPHMSACSAVFLGRTARIARVSFTGERCYEISVPASLAAEVWRRTRAAGAQALGVEALSVLRAEKGYIFVGQDTDSETIPQDIGMGGAREQRSDGYVGDRSLFTPAATRRARKQLVGIAVAGAAALPIGAHAVAVHDGKLRSIGFVTSSYPSEALARPVALGLIEDGSARLGEVLEFEHLSTRWRGTLVPPCFLDPAGQRLYA